MNSKNINSSAWWIILIMLGIAWATMWWFGREIKTIDQQIETIEKK